MCGKPISGASGDEITRHEPCRLCGGSEAEMVAETDYWDIRSTRIVRCTACGLMQLDPMLTAEETARGCLAYHVEEHLRIPRHEQERNLVRNFRRGVHFAQGLRRRGFHPRHLLELGPGSGYFAAGMQRVLPALRVTVMDVVPEVLEANERDHGYQGIQAMPETPCPALEGQADLVVARDILEHVIDIGAVLRNANAWLKPGGLLHFITPNGHEDVWKHRLTWAIKGQRSELLINHVNYFDGAGLRRHLENAGLQAVEYYTYGFKTTLRGRGWRKVPKLFAPVSMRRSATPFVEEHMRELSAAPFLKVDVLPGWYTAGSLTALGWLSSYQHGHILRLKPMRDLGHEIHGLFRKRA